MADKVSKFIFPVKSGNTITDKEFDLPSGGSVTVDDALSDTSTNPVQNKVVKTAIDGKSNTGHNHDERYYTEAEENQIIEALQSTIVDSIYPIGSLYMSINDTMPSFLTKGRIWKLLPGEYVLKTISSGTGGITTAAGNTGSTTLTAAQSGVPAHSHGMGNHSHPMQHNHVYQVRAHAYWGAMAGGDTDAVKVYDFYNGYVPGASWAADSYVNVNNGLQSGATGRSITQTASSGYTAGADYVRDGVNTGAGGSGSTYNNSASNASEGHAHTAGMPANIGIYIWKRVA